MDILDKKLILIGGKGGVGKTSISAAAALYSSKKGKKTLILSTDPAHSLSDSYDVAIGNKTTKINENLDALEIDASILLKDYMGKNSKFLKQIADDGTFFSTEEIEKFFDLSLPGMDEVMALIKITDILEENKYDLIVLDTAPTGHTIRLLELPGLMLGYVKLLAEMRQKHKVVVSMIAGRYTKDDADRFIDKLYMDMKKISELLKDTKKTKFIPITIPEDMSLQETGRLIQILERHKIPISEIMVNKITGEDCEFCNTRRKYQLNNVKNFKEKFKKYKIVEVPDLGNEIRGKNLDDFSDLIFNGKPFKKQKSNPKGTNIAFSQLNIGEEVEIAFFGGKGGVGKTVCSAATALHLSKSKKVMIFSTDPAHSLSDCFNTPIGGNITKINENLDALEIDSMTLFNEIKLKYKTDIQKFFRSIFTKSKIGTIDAPYDRRVMEDLFDLAPPGIDEIMAMKIIMDMMKKKKYDLYILDTAPSGHTIRLLEMPQIAEGWVRTLFEIIDKYPVPIDIGALNDVLDTIIKLKEELSNPIRSEFVVVTIPEAMALFETEDLLKSLERLKVTVKNLVINKILPISSCNFCSIRRKEQDTYIKKLKGLKLNTSGIELLKDEAFGPELEKIQKFLFSAETKI
jgi:arsenite/tail-anchored protein-transporting ATPase